MSKGSDSIGRGVAFSAPVLGLLVMLAASGCGRKAVEAKVAEAPQPISVKVAHVEKRTFHRTIEQPAWIEAFEETPIHAKISGYVETVNVEIGARVKKGDVLAVISMPELVEELSQKDVLVAQSAIEIDQSEKHLRVAEAHFETSKSLIAEAQAAQKRSLAHYQRWKSELDRMQDLTKAKVIDSQTRDETQHQFQAAQAMQEEAEAKIQTALANERENAALRDKAQADLAAAKNNRELAKADRRRVAAMLDYTTIKAPYDGVVSERHVHTGHLLQATSSNDKRDPLFVVMRTDRVRIFLNVPEASAALIRNGQLTTINIPVLNDRKFVGKVTGTSWSLSPTQRTLCTEVDFDNSEEMLRPGTYAHAALDVSIGDAFSVPSAAVAIRDGAAFCYVIDGRKAVKTTVRTGIKEGRSVEILKKLSHPTEPGDKAVWEDFSGNETVITSDVSHLSDGQLVESEPKAG
jgi:RND family efflux transporter MFP subunit